MALNPTELTIGGITYPAGAICFITDGGLVVKDDGIVLREDWTKRVLRWDLRKVGAPAGSLTDHNGNGIADWNDVFSVGVTEADMRAIGGGLNVANVGREGAFSSDGKWFYFISTAEDNPGLGGVWKMHAETGALTRIWADPGAGNTIVEPTVIHTSVRDFTGGTGIGDQILIDATPNGGNLGGANYLLDTGTTVTGPHPLFTRAFLESYIEWTGKFCARAEVNGADPGVYNSANVLTGVSDYASTPDGTVYMLLDPSTEQQSLWRWDTKGRMACIKSKHQHALFNAALGSSGSAATTHRMEVREVTYGSPGFTVRQIMYQQVSGKCIAGVYDFKTGDFDRDGIRGPADMAIFYARKATPIETFVTGTAPNRKFFEAASNGSGVQLEVADPVAYEQYLRCDVNGNGLVTDKDAEILRPFFPGDADLDGDVDVNDFATFQACFNGPNNAPAQTGCDWMDMDRDGDVDVNDFAVFQACFNGSAQPLACQD